MPELPEVETITNDLRPVLEGARFESVTAHYGPSAVCEKYDFDDLRDKAVIGMERRGKFMNIFFEDDFVVTVHLRMSGRLLVREASEETLRFERVRLDFDRCSLRFTDIRKFGRVWLNKVNDYEAVTGIGRLGVEPLNGDLDLEKFVELFQGRRGMVKKWLLDQSKIAGIGNIYADEACFYAGIRPDAAMEKLDHAKLERLFEGVIKALKQGVRNRGTSISDFADAHGNKGSNQEVLYVYGRGGKECLNCGEKLTRTRVATRGTVFCTSCQS